MAKKCSKAVEVLPSSSIEWLVGSVKTSTARVCKNGRNIVMPKVKQSNKIGADPKMFTGAGEKWRALTSNQKQSWKEIAREKQFRSAWHAFNSSFFRSVAIHGLDYTMTNQLNYIKSDSRYKKAEALNNSVKRLKKYKTKSEFYSETEEILKIYPVAYSSPHVHFRLRDLNDVNNALAMKWIYRTDDFLQYEFSPIEQDQYTEKGSYTLIKRPRQGEELYQVIHN